MYMLSESLLEVSSYPQPARARSVPSVCTMCACMYVVGHSRGSPHDSKTRNRLTADDDHVTAAMNMHMQAGHLLHGILTT